MKMIQALAPEKGDTVLDLCAAPGGKSLAAAERMGNEGRVISCDIYDHKLRLIERAAQRLGVTIVETRKTTAQYLTKNLPESQIKSSWMLPVPVWASCAASRR